jgi:hypothetical protein
MAIAFVKSLFAGSAKPIGASLVLSGSLSVAQGNTIFVAVGTSNTAGDPISITDNLGNTYALVGNPGSVSTGVAWLFRADITNPGTLTSITIAQARTPVMGAIAVEFSGVGALRTAAPGNSNTSALNMNAFPGGTGSATAQYQAGDLWIGSFLQRSANTFGSDSSPAYPASEPTPEQRTSGSAGSTNVSVGLLYYKPASTPGFAGSLLGIWSAGGAAAAASGVAIKASVGITTTDTCTGRITLSGSVVESYQGAPVPIGLDFEMSMEMLQTLSFDALTMGPSGPSPSLPTFDDAPTGRIRMRA